MHYTLTLCFSRLNIQFNKMQFCVELGSKIIPFATSLLRFCICCYIFRTRTFSKWNSCFICFFFGTFEFLPFWFSVYFCFGGITFLYVAVYFKQWKYSAVSDLKITIAPRAGKSNALLASLGFCFLFIWLEELEYWFPVAEMN